MSLSVVDALARLQRAAKASQLQLRIRSVPPEIGELISLLGLDGVLHVGAESTSPDENAALTIELHRDEHAPPA